MSFVKSYGVATGSAVTYEVVYALGQWANTQKAMNTVISNGEIVELSVGAVTGLVGYFGLKGKLGGMTTAALMIPTSAFLIVDGIANVIKRNLGAGTQFTSVAQARGVRAVSGVRQVIPQATAFSPLTSSSN
jgi:hypothetical protein